MTTARTWIIAFAWTLLTGCGGNVDSPSSPASGGVSSGGSGGSSSGGTSSGGNGGTTPVTCNEGASCDDGNSCTLGDHCELGQCRGAPSPDCGPIVHEWGTYTSVHATDGHALGGVHHVDEALPSWVHRRDFTPQSYFFEELPEEPREQLETPVLYFHSAGVQKVKVEVSFPEGIVGEWFPEATSFSPEISAMKELGSGAMSWDVTLDPAIDPASFPPVDPAEIWAPSRNVKSTPLVGPAEEREQFIFYRGLAKFTPELTTSVAKDGTITLLNESNESLGAVFLLRANSTGGTFASLGALGPHATLTAQTPAIEGSLEDFLASARKGLHEALVTTGLYPDEAQAMVDTWTRSWFKNDGIRVLYIAPRSWTDAWLPMTITPKPAELTRTLVGRVELLTHEEEDQLTSDLKTAVAGGSPISIESLGRFAEPRLARAAEQATDPEAQILAEKLRQEVHLQP